jgi:SAM-dependent methyltransferase
MVEHAGRLVERLIDERRIQTSDLVVEIGSNDGYLLQHYVKRGIRVLGIDPAANVVDAALARAVPTRCGFFGSVMAEEILGSEGPATVIHANNVMAHVPEINDIVSSIARLLAPGGVAVIETPYVRDLVDGLEFDTIYHEHLFYYSLRALQTLFHRNGLQIVDVEHLKIHGGSLRVSATRLSDEATVADTVRALESKERELGIDAHSFYEGFQSRVDQLLHSLRSFLAGRVEAGRRIAGYGAAAKGTVLLNALETGIETVRFVVDSTPYKQGRYVPGVRIPIVDPKMLETEMPDDVLILAWNFVDAIVAKESEYKQRGGVFLIPLPEPKAIA